MKVCTYNEFKYYKIFGYLSLYEYYYVNILYEFESSMNFFPMNPV
jgi:hypothetical protein